MPVQSLLVDGLDLIPKGQNLLVVRPGFPIDPLAQDALGIVRPREATPWRSLWS